MTNGSTKVIDDLIRDLRLCGYQVVCLGRQYRVTYPNRPGQAFLPLTLGKHNDTKGIAKGLLDIGFTDALVREHRDRDRRERQEADRKAAERAANVAKAKAAVAAGLADGTVGTGKQRAAAALAGGHTLAAVEGAVELEDVLTEPTHRPAEPRTSIVDMTPALATELLVHNRMYHADRKEFQGRTNRPFQRERAREYMAAMLRGEWSVLTHQGVALDTALDLLDGQHRLAAVIMAGEVNPDIVVPMMVTYDLDPAAADRIDIGKRRTTADVLSMYGEANTTGLAAITRLCILYDEVGHSPEQWKKTPVSPAQVRDFIAAEPDIRLAATVAQGSYKNARIMLVSAGGAAIHLIGRHHGHDAARAYWETIATGRGLTGDKDPANAVRNLLINMASDRNRKRDAPWQLAVLIKGFNQRFQGLERTLMRWSYVEPMPRVVSRATNRDG